MKDTMNRRDFIRNSVVTEGVLLAHAALPANARNLTDAKAGKDLETGTVVDDGLLRGVCDIHLHCRPDSRDRSVDEYGFMKDALASTGIHKPDAEWALDYLWDIPEVSVAVSGMGSMEDVEENLKYASKAKPNMLSPAEREALGAAIYAYRHAPGHIDCTGCYQCIPCPQHLDIPRLLAKVK